MRDGSYANTTHMPYMQRSSTAILFLFFCHGKIFF